MTVTTSLESVQCYLDTRGASLDHISKFADDLPPDMALMLVGSVAAGRGHPHSDIDLFVLGGAGDGARRHDFTVVTPIENTVIQAAAGFNLNVQYWPESFISETAEVMSACYDSLLRPADSRLRSLSSSQYALVHEVRIGLPLRNVEQVAELRTRLRVDELPLHAVLQHVSLHYSRREDAIGQAKSGNDESAKWMLRLCIGALAQAALASLDETNYRYQWLVRSLRENEEELGGEAVHRYLDVLQNWPDGNARDVVRDTLSFADREIAEIFARKMELLPLALTIGKRIKTAREL